MKTLKMKTQRECHEALCAGKTLIDIYGTLHKYNEDGDLVRRCPHDSDWEKFTYLFIDPENWAVYEGPKPEKPTLKNLAALENWDWFKVTLPNSHRLLKNKARNEVWTHDYLTLQTALSAGWPVEFGRDDK